MTRNLQKRRALPRDVALAKFTRPALAGVYCRKRLFRSLDIARRRPVIWISAPAGSGKTTLIASYLQARSLPVLWYEIDAGDKDVASFFYYMGRAVKQTGGARATLPLFTQEYAAGLSAFTVNYFRALFARLKRPSVVVFDNYQEVSSESVLSDVLSQGLEQVVTDVTVVVLSREEPPAALARLRASGRMTLLGWEDLKLTETESAAIAKLRCKRKALQPDRLQALYAGTGGWVAGVVLLTERAGADIDQLAVGDTGTQSIFDYFASEVFRRSTPNVQHFLLETAFLPKIAIPIARRLTGHEDSAAILRGLARRNYFTVVHTDGSYEYHPLFRAFLVSRAEATYTPETMSALKCRTAEVLAAHGDAENAITLLQQTGRWDAALDLLLKQAQSLYAQGRTETLEGWLKMFPESFRGENAWVLYWLGVCRLPYAPAEARAHFERAFGLFEKGSNTSAIYLTWSRIIESFLNELNDFTPMNRWLERYPTLQDGREPPSRGIEEASLFTYIAGLVNARFDHPDLPALVARADGLFEKETEERRRMTKGFALILYYTWRGDIIEMGKLMERVPASIRSPESNAQPLARLNWYLVMSIHAADLAAADDSLSAVVDGLALADASGVHALDLHLLSYGLWGQLCAGNLAQSRELLRRIAPFRDQGLLKKAVYHHCESLLAVHEGDADRAVAECLRAVELADACGLYLGSVSYRIGLAYAHAQQGDPALAAAALADVRPRVRAMGSLSNASYCALCEANIHRLRGHHELALRALDEALSIARQGGFVTPTFCPRESAALLYEMALDADIQPDYVRATIAQTRLPPPSSSTSRKWPWRVRLYTFGGFSVIKDGRPLTFRGRTHKKPLELLRAIVAHGGRNVRFETVAQALWPDADGDMASHALETTLYRLRKLLGDGIVLVQNRELTLNADYCWVDVRAFDRLTQPTIEKKPIDHARELIELYRGPFLAGDDSHVVLAQRESRRTKFLRTLSHAANLLEVDGRLDDVVQIYQQAVEADPLAETLYRQLMCCYRRLNRPAEALAWYRRCEAALSQALGIQPSGETRALYEETKQEP